MLDAESDARGDKLAAVLDINYTGLGTLDVESDVTGSGQGNDGIVYIPYVRIRPVPLRIPFCRVVKYHKGQEEIEMSGT